MKTTKALLLDMDGVVIDSHAVALALLCSTAQRYAPDITIGLIQTWGSLSSRQFWNKIKSDYGVAEDLDMLIRSYPEDDEIALYHGMKPIEGVPGLLDQAMDLGIKTALVTSASRKRMDAVVDLFNLRGRFDATVCDDEVAASKPDPRIYLKAAEKLGAYPENCVVLEDSGNGVQSAKRAGMKCIGVKVSRYVDEDLSGADKVIRNFEEIDLNDLFPKSGVA